MFDKPNFTRALRDLACLLLLFCLRRTSFPPTEWEASPPPTGTQLPGFPPLKPVVGPGDEGPFSFEHLLSPGWMAPSQGHFPGNLLCAEEFQSPNQAAGRQHFSLGSDQELVFVLRISSSLETISSALARGPRCSSCVFIYLSLSELGTSPLLLFCRLEICNNVFVPINKKYFSDTLSHC